MKQLSVYASEDLEDRVVAAFDHAGVDAYMKIGDATGVRFSAPGQLPRTMTWGATLFVVPAADRASIDRVVGELKQYAGTCEVEPCLRIVVSAVEELH